MSEHGQGFSVFIVDDDGAVRDSMALMLSLLGFSTAVFEDAEACLSAWRADWVGCLVVDLRLPGMSGLDLQSELRRRGSHLPFVVITAHGDVSSARAAFQSEAVDFLEKPFEQASLCQAIERGMQMEKRRIEVAYADADQAGKLTNLTLREREVLTLAGKGLHAKEIAEKLGISPRTVEVHKARLMEKLGARNVSELVRFAIQSKLE